MAAFIVEPVVFYTEPVLNKCSILFKETLQSNNDLYDEIKAIMNDNNFEEKATELILNSNCKNLLKKVKEHSDNYYWKKNNYYSTTYITEKMY